MCSTRIQQQIICYAVDEPFLTSRVPGSKPSTRLSKVVLLHDHIALATTGEGARRRREALSVAYGVESRREIIDLFIALHEVHEAIVMVVMMRAFGCVRRQHQVIAAETMALRILIGKDASLQEFVVAVMNTGDDKGRTEGQLLVFLEEIIGIAVENHSSHRLKREQVLWPDLGDIQRVKIKLLLIVGIHDLDKETPFGVLASSDGIVEVLRGVAVVLAADNCRLIVEERFDPAGRFPVELDEGLTALSIDEDKGVDAKAFHVAVILRNSDVVE